MRKTLSPGLLGQFGTVGSDYAGNRNALTNAASLLNPAVAEALFQGTGYDLGQGRSYNLDKSTVAANVPTRGIADLLGLDLGSKHDAYTRKDVPAISRRLDHLFGLLPAYRQAGQALNDQPNGNLARARYLLGVNAYPYDKAKADYYARKYGK